MLKLIQVLLPSRSHHSGLRLMPKIDKLTLGPLFYDHPIDLDFSCSRWFYRYLIPSLDRKTLSGVAILWRRFRPTPFSCPIITDIEVDNPAVLQAVVSQNVPISIQALGGQSIRELGLQNFKEYDLFIFLI